MVIFCQNGQMFQALAFRCPEGGQVTGLGPRGGFLGDGDVTLSGKDKNHRKTTGKT